MSESGKINPMVYAVVLNYNGWQDTIECINSLLNINYKNFKIIIVDNKSNDGSVAEIINYFKNSKPSITIIDSSRAEKSKSESGKVILISSKKNGGYGYGNNIGIKYALKNKADYVLVLNNDTIVDPDFLQPLVDRCEKDENIGIISGKVMYYSEPDIIWSNGGYVSPLTGMIRHLNYNEKNIGQIPKREITFISGCMWLVPVIVFKKTGLINEEFFMYVEDLEFCQRVLNDNFKLSIVPESKIWHKVGESKKSFSKFSVYWKSRNHTIFFKKNYACFFKKAIKILIFSIIFSVRLLKTGKPNRILDLFRGIFNGLRTTG